jgi:hypothetical protein
VPVLDDLFAAGLDSLCEIFDLDAKAVQKEGFFMVLCDLKL